MQSNYIDYTQNAIEYLRIAWWRILMKKEAN